MLVQCVCNKLFLSANTQLFCCFVCDLLISICIDHNQYIHKGWSWQSNYCAGLRVLDASNLASGESSEKAFFDVSPECDTAVFSGMLSTSISSCCHVTPILFVFHLNDPVHQASINDLTGLVLCVML
jgi:hypothetical protein